MRALPLFATLFPVAAMAALAVPVEPVAADPQPACVLRQGPGDLVSQDRTLVVPENRRADDVVALRGDVVVRRGASVKRAIALGGSVVVEKGATVRESALAFGGDVRVAAGARVEKDVMAFGGRVRAAAGAEVPGRSLAFSFELEGKELAARIVEGLRALAAPCRVERSPEQPRVAPPRETPGEDL